MKFLRGHAVVARALATTTRSWLATSGGQNASLLEVTEVEVQRCAIESDGLREFGHRRLAEAAGRLEDAKSQRESNTLPDRSLRQQELGALNNCVSHDDKNPKGGARRSITRRSALNEPLNPMTVRATAIDRRCLALAEREA